MTSRPTSGGSRLRLGRADRPPAPPSFDFHGAVVDAAQNSLLSHVNAMIRVGARGGQRTARTRTERERGDAPHGGGNGHPRPGSLMRPRRRCARSSTSPGAGVADDKGEGRP